MKSKMSKESKLFLAVSILAFWMMFCELCGLTKLWAYPLYCVTGLTLINMLLSTINDIVNSLERRHRYDDWAKHQKDS